MKPAKHIAAVAAVAAVGCIQGCTLLKTAVHNFADLDDHAIFDNRAVEPAARPSALRTLSRTPRFLSELRVPDEAGRPRTLDDYLDETRSAAFVVIRDDRIVYERYARGYDERSMLNSFSIAKSMLATLVSMAIADGRISSLDATVADYRPDFAATPYGGVTLRHLLGMKSGVGRALAASGPGAVLLRR